MIEFLGPHSTASAHPWNPRPSRLPLEVENKSALHEAVAGIVKVRI